jgi:hypothetical protein
MRLIDYYYSYDFGNDAYLIIGQFRKFNVFDASFHSSSYWDWEPNVSLSLSVFAGSVFSFRIEILSFSLSMNLISYRYAMDLSHTREQ